MKLIAPLHGFIGHSHIIDVREGRKCHAYRADTYLELLQDN